MKKFIENLTVIFFVNFSVKNIRQVLQYKAQVQALVAVPDVFELQDYGAKDYQVTLAHPVQDGHQDDGGRDDDEDRDEESRGDEHDRVGEVVRVGPVRAAARNRQEHC